MNGRHYLIVALAALAAFAGGFLLANNLNRTETDRLRSEIESMKAEKKSDGSNPESLNLTNEEIDAKIAEANQNPDNIQYQKSLGIALYRYGAMKQEAAIVEKAITILERANRLDPKDNELLIALGNSYFDIGYFRKENSGFQRARDYYETALKARPHDAALRTDLALTYFLQQPPELAKAATEFERAVSNDPTNERALQYYIQTLSKQGNSGKAREVLEKLQTANPQNSAIGELTSLVNSAAMANIK